VRLEKPQEHKIINLICNITTTVRHLFSIFHTQLPTSASNLKDPAEANIYAGQMTYENSVE